ncbi:PREDICTED: testis-expressed sequence 264 protein-like [Amphimedon queenslandica]|uniref:Uncharacterized protein n=1 Tax=Amphimedon queenslandica TaxID=400682 RepID=A0A1X7VU21_AMPQE|nr:PREDICTED: testis-expressed sequence 264 protein-like [Amphimedon queenslandica]|eukprot:XP_003382656.1 PREDICTED: testis-expressed sequence 264 protein-like [Amphimedon queenslandica]
MDLFYILLGLFLLVVLAIFLYLLYSGLFYTYTIRCAIPASIPNRFAYTFYIGPYQKIGSACWRLCSIVPRSTIFVVYYDNPDKVAKKDHDQLRAAVCCPLLPEPSPSLESRLMDEGYKIGTFPNCTKALITEFPYRTSTSIMIAVSRVYPSLVEYIKDYKLEDSCGPCIEVYKDDSIQFVWILEPKDGFAIPQLPPPPPLIEEPPASKETKKDQ